MVDPKPAAAPPSSRKKRIAAQPSPSPPERDEAGDAPPENTPAERLSVSQHAQLKTLHEWSAEQKNPRPAADMAEPVARLMRGDVAEAGTARPQPDDGVTAKEDVEEWQNTGHNKQIIIEFKLRPVVDTEERFRHYHALLVDDGISEQDRLRVAKAQALLADDVINNPALAKAKLAALDDVQRAATGQRAEPQSWMEKTRATPAYAALKVDQVVPPPPTQAPALYAERPRDPKTGRQEGVDKFLPRAYASWVVPDPEGGRPILTLPRKLIAELDPDCDDALTHWPGNHKGQEFPIKIARKNAVEPVSPEEAKEARRKVNRADYLRRREARQGGGATSLS
jgi:hypothetical protein